MSKDTEGRKWSEWVEREERGKGVGRAVRENNSKKKTCPHAKASHSEVWNGPGESQ